ncbi:MAG: tetratricopeptide repeat protein, partial [bacterium]|nr:tetratricopeptide repeat protein [bacterium]
RGFRRRWKGLVAAAIALLTAVLIAYFVHRCAAPPPVKALRAVSVPGARLYSEGLVKLRSFDAMSARELLEAAVEADPENPLPRAALAAAFSELGYDGKAEQAAEKAMELSRGLREHEQLAIKARYYEISEGWDRAIEIYGSLFRSFPEDVDYGLRLAEAQISGGRSRQALVTLEKLRRLPSPGSSDPRIDLVQALAHLRLGKLRDSVTSAERAARKGNESGWDLLVARARLREAAALWEQGDYSRAIPALDDAGARFAAAGDRRGLAQTFEANALAVQAQGDLDGSRNLLQRALTTYREIGDKRSEANVLVTLGNVFMEEGRPAAAEKRYYEALAVCKELNPRSLTTARVLLNIGVKFHTQGELAAALEKYQEAQARFAELGDPVDSAITQTNIAEIHYLRGNLDRAREMHENALAIRREIGDRNGEAYDTFRLGKVFAAKGWLFVARDKYEEALAARDRMGETIAAEGIRVELASLALLQGRTDEAERLARQAEEVLWAERVMDLTALAQVVLARALLVQGRLPQAQQAGARARTIAETCEDRGVRLSTAIVAGRVRAAAGAAEEVTAALHELEDVATQAAAAGFVEHAFEARLAAGEIEAASGKTAAAAVRLEALAKEASDQGFGQIAQRARAALAP